MTDYVTLAMGAGGKQTSELITNVFKKHLENQFFTADDAAVLPQPDGQIAMSTDGFIVSPAFFPGGNVGELSVCGTVNDLTCMGARPLYLTCSFVIEEGYPVALLEKIVSSMAETAGKCGVSIVAGDTKVAGKGQVDGCFITTAGVGEIVYGTHTSGAFARPGDAVIVTGDVGRHGCAILLSRDEYGIEADVTSDCAPLWKPLSAVFKKVHDIHAVRDATRGGVGTVLYEICHESGVGIEISRERVPVDSAVRGVCDMLGLDPLYLACEGRMVITAPSSDADEIVGILRDYDDTAGAAVIGEVSDEHQGHVTVKTPIGTETYLPEPGNELLPRIC
ncbi:MAG: hydrogenase expression/formation protein HypE [bacterium LCO1.1]|uniref:Hydrogenase expression/formation protein HypE n=1 Tax=Candidatus Weimeria bifida TaxID=2599074 RepID=A0A6N7IY71_9FIRM|nr:hydrogenase expression/formation protein HypE [Candidatus Weimeria bifida]